MSDERVCENCGGTEAEGEIIEHNDALRHARMEHCIRFLSEQFRKKRSRSTPPRRK